MMRLNRWLLSVVTVAAALTLWAAQRVSQAAASSTMTITEKTTIVDVALRAQKFTTAKIVFDEAAKEAARRYTFPPHLAGTPVKLSPATAALDFICGTGWEGSPLAAAQRLKAPSNWKLARTPYTYETGAGKEWVCNNRQWTWRYAKQAGGRAAGGVITIALRTQPDGDIVAGKKFTLTDVKDDYTLDMLLDLMNKKTEIIVNVVPYDSQFRPMQAVSPQTKKVETKLVRMTAGTLPLFLREKLTEPLTPGEFLSLMAVGLNRHTRRIGGNWKWSSEKSGHEVIYTLRDYAHLEE